MDLYVIRIFLTIVATHLFVSTQCDANDVSVNTTHGLVKGVSTYESGTKVDKYLGIPYAMPPVGDLRFKDPVPRKTWKNTWNATEFTAFCAMVGLEMSEEVKMSEDCLYLNVFVPEVFGGPIDGLPVVVLLGSLPVELRPSGKLPVTESMMRDGSILAAVESVVVVTVNFRRDVFGFLATADSETAGNYALKDQNMAMKWVKDNIAHFKGDPNRITLGGLVGGGTYVAMHMVSPASTRLFQRAFMTGIVSPFSDAPRKHYPGGGLAATFAKELAQYASCPTGNGDEGMMMSCLREVTAEKLINASISLYEERYKNQTGGYWIFMDRVDGSFIPEDVTTLWQQGSYDNVPLLVGGEPVLVDSDFGVVHEITEKEYKSEILRLVSSMPWETPSQNSSYFQPLAEAAMFVYNNWTNGGRKMAQQIIKMEGDKKEAGQIKMLSVFTDNENKNSSEKAAVYKYIFNYRSSSSRTQGVPMGEDVMYLLGEPRKSGRWTVQDRQVSQLMMKFYGNFIYYGNPTYGSGVSWWPVFDSTDQNYLEVNREGRTDIQQNYRKDKMSFWNQLRPMMISRIEDIVVDVRQYPDQYNTYVDPQRITENEDKTKEENCAECQNTKNDTSIIDDDDEDNDMHKYFLATWILAGVGIVLTICIVVLICITYKAKTEAYTFEATKL